MENNVEKSVNKEEKVDFFDSLVERRGLSADKKWFREQVETQWISRLAAEWKFVEKEQAAFAERTAHEILKEAPRMPWKAPHKMTMAQWARQLAKALLVMAKSHSVAQDEPGVVSFMSATNATRAVTVFVSKQRFHVYNEPCVWTVRVRNRDFQFCEADARVLNKGFLSIAQERDEKRAAHFARLPSEAEGLAAVSELQALWSRDATVREAWAESENLKTQIEQTRIARQAQAAQKSSNERKSEGRGGWNALGTCYIGGSGLPYSNGWAGF